MMEAPVQLAIRVGLLLQALQDVLPDLSPLPPVEPAGDGLPGAVALGEIPPGCSGAKEPKDGINDGAMILARPPSAWFLGWKERSEPLPLLISEFMSSHPLAYDAFADTPVVSVRAAS